MKETEIIENLRNKLSMLGGRHLYGILGSYEQIESFSAKLQEARTHDGRRFPKPLSVNKGILNAIPDEEFRRLVEDEAKRPEPTAAHVAKAFETFLRQSLGRYELVVLTNLEILFSYNIELNLLRVMATDEQRIVLLLPGRMQAGQIILFPDIDKSTYSLPPNLIAHDHIWTIS